MWNTKEKQEFKNQLKFEAASHKKLAFFYEQLQQQAPVKFAVEPVDFHRSREYAQLQKKGVDTILHLETGKQLYVQEKHIRNKDTVYLEYEKPNGKPSWAVDEKELAHMLVFHFVKYGKAYVMDFQKLVSFVKEQLPLWEFLCYRENVAVHSGYKGIKIPTSELLNNRYELGLKEYYAADQSDLDRLLYGI